MSAALQERRYTKSHEWVKKIDDTTVSVGITEFAQQQLGDIVFVDLPEVSQQLLSGDDVAVVESVKTAADIYMPMSGTVAKVNTVLASEPEQVNQDPFNEGWLFYLTVSDWNEYDALLSYDDYQSTVTGE